jgi:inositol oxygenase
MMADGKANAAYRDYGNEDNPAVARVRAFYRQNHTHQTLAFVLAKKAQWLQFDQREMTPWQALDFLNTLVDESDPDIELPQISHLLQTAEAIRADGHPDWCMTWARCCACSASRSGRWSVTRFRWAAGHRTASCTPSSLL